MPWLTGKLIGYALVGLLSAGILAWGYGAVRDYFIGVDNLQTQLSNERELRGRAELERDTIKQTNAMRERHAAELVTIRAESDARIEQYRMESDNRKEVLEDKDKLKRVAIGKPEILERLSNNATEKVFSELQDIYNTD